MSVVDAAAEQSSAVDVSVIVVSYNTRELTCACLRSIIAQTQSASLEVLVVDNDSGDGSADAIEEAYPGVRLIRSRANLGFARANNLAARLAGGKRLLLLNPDTRILDGAIDRLIDFADAHPDAGIWGGRTLFEDGSLNPTSCWREQTLWGLACRAVGLTVVLPKSELFNPESYGGWARDRARRVDIVTGCFLLIDAELWSLLDGFDERFFMYGEEADLCIRARGLGATPLITPNATIIHHGGASEDHLPDKEVRLLAAKISLVDKHWSGLKRLSGRQLFKAWTFLRAAVYTLVASVSRRPDHHARASHTRRVWNRRHEWLTGYST